MNKSTKQKLTKPKVLRWYKKLFCLWLVLWSLLPPLLLVVLMAVNPKIKKWMGGREVEGTGLENQQGGDSFVGSNPTPSANLEILQSGLYLLLPASNEGDNSDV